MGVFLAGCSLVSLDGLSGGTATVPVDGNLDTGIDVLDSSPLEEATTDAPADASAPCRLDAPFGTPELVAGLDALGHAGAARFTDDELLAYMQSDGKIFVARRTSRDAPFDAPTRLAEVVVNSPSAAEFHAFPSPNALKLWFTSTRSGNEDLYVVNRSSLSTLFGDLAEVPGVNTSDLEQAPWVSPDERELFFASQRSDGAGSLDLYRAEWVDASYGEPIPLTEVNTSALETLPVLSRDGLRLFFSSNRPGGIGGVDVWTAQRSDLKGTFSSPQNVSELNSTMTDWVSWISPDGCRIYLDSNRQDAEYLIYVATRPSLAE